MAERERTRGIDVRDERGRELGVGERERTRGRAMSPV